MRAPLRDCSCCDTIVITPPWKERPSTARRRSISIKDRDVGTEAEGDRARLPDNYPAPTTTTLPGGAPIPRRRGQVAGSNAPPIDRAPAASHRREQGQAASARGSRQQAAWRARASSRHPPRGAGRWRSSSAGATCGVLLRQRLPHLDHLGSGPDLVDRVARSRAYSSSRMPARRPAQPPLRAGPQRRPDTSSRGHRCSPGLISRGTPSSHAASCPQIRTRGYASVAPMVLDSTMRSLRVWLLLPSASSS